MSLDALCSIFRNRRSELRNRAWARQGRRQRLRKHRLEMLEDRRLLATFSDSGSTLSRT